MHRATLTLTKLILKFILPLMHLIHYVKNYITGYDLLVAFFSQKAI